MTLKYIKPKTNQIIDCTNHYYTKTNSFFKFISEYEPDIGTYNIGFNTVNKTLVVFTVDVLFKGCYRFDGKTYFDIHEIPNGENLKEHILSPSIFQLLLLMNRPVSRIQALLELGFDVNLNFEDTFSDETQNEDSDSSIQPRYYPLTYAMLHNRPDVVLLLLNNNSKTDDWETFIHYVKNDDMRSTIKMKIQMM